MMTSAVICKGGGVQLPPSFTATRSDLIARLSFTVCPGWITWKQIASAIFISVGYKKFITWSSGVHIKGVVFIAPA